MYGLVNRAIEDLVIKAHGSERWQAVLDAADVAVERFEAMEPYDDSITYKLVGAASDVLETPATDLLEAFGRHWILYTGAEGWGAILEAQGSSVAEVVGNLNAMHARVRVAMPSIVVPEFRVIEATEAVLRFEYHSHRDGLAPMVVGLMRGLAERFGESWSVHHSGTRDQDGFDTFELQPLPVTSAASA